MCAIQKRWRYLPHNKGSLHIAAYTRRTVTAWCSISILNLPPLNIASLPLLLALLSSFCLLRPSPPSLLLQLLLPLLQLVLLLLRLLLLVLLLLCFPLLCRASLKVERATERGLAGFLLGTFCQVAAYGVHWISFSGLRHHLLLQAACWTVRRASSSSAAPCWACTCTHELSI